MRSGPNDSAFSRPPDSSAIFSACSASPVGVSSFGGSFERSRARFAQRATTTARSASA